MHGFAILHIQQQNYFFQWSECRVSHHTIPKDHTVFLHCAWPISRCPIALLALYFKKSYCRGIARAGKLQDVHIRVCAVTPEISAFCIVHLHQFNIKLLCIFIFYLDIFHTFCLIYINRSVFAFVYSSFGRFFFF